MTAASTVAPRAFAVWWKDLERWVIPTSLLLRHALPPGWERVRVGAVVRQVSARLKAEAEKEYKMAGVKWYGEGVFHRETVRGDGMSATYVTQLVPGALIYNRLFAWKASFAIVPPEYADCYVSNEFPQFISDPKRILPEYLYLFCTRNATIRAVNAASTGSAAVSRNRFKEEQFLGFEIALPPLDEQKHIVEYWRRTKDKITDVSNRVMAQRELIEAQFLADLGLSAPSQRIRPKCLAVWWKDSARWDLTYFRRPTSDPNSTKYPNVRLRDVVYPLSKTTHRIEPSTSTPDADLNYLGMENIEPVSGTLINFVPRKGRTIKSSCVQFDKGHILYGKLRPYLRKVVDCSELPFDEGIASSEFLSLRPKERVLQNWLALFLRSIVISEQAKVAIGARMPRISPDTLLNFVIPLPPHAIQQQIMARVAAGRAEIAREQESAERLSKEIIVDVEALILGEKRVAT